MKINMKKTVFYLIFSTIALTLYSSCGYTPQNGDIIFQITPNSDFSDAITNATAWEDSIKFSHVAMIALYEDGTPYIIEASPKYGVCITEWDDFLDNSMKIKGKPGVVIKRLKIDFPQEEVIVRALKCIGEPYDWSYYPNNGEKYCSELIYDTYLDKNGEHIFKAHPMNFRDSDGNIPIFWIDLFEKLGKPIPEGVPGTNPNDLSKDPLLMEVFRLF